MTKYREIFRLKSLGPSRQSIANSCNISKKTINRVLKRSKDLDISWPLDKSDTDAILAEKFPPFVKQVKSNKRMPDYDYVHKELLCDGVSKKTLVDRIHGGLPCKWRRITYVFPVLLSHAAG